MSVPKSVLLQLSLEMIVSENGQKSDDDIDTVRQLKEELNKLSTENVQFGEMVGEIFMSLTHRIHISFHL